MLAPFPTRWSRVSRCAPGTPGALNPNDARPRGSAFAQCRPTRFSPSRYRPNSNAAGPLSSDRDPREREAASPIGRRKIDRLPLRGRKQRTNLSACSTKSVPQEVSCGPLAQSPGQGSVVQDVILCPWLRTGAQSGVILLRRRPGWPAGAGLTKYTPTFPPDPCTSAGYTYNV